jgi:hypothetical protein
VPVYKYEPGDDYYKNMTSAPLMCAHDTAIENDMHSGAVLMGPDDADAPVTLLLGIKPGGVLIKHGHDTFRVEVVVRGSMTLPDGQVLTPGDVMVTPPGNFYGPHVAGPEGVLTAEIFASASGLLPYPAPDEADQEIVEMLAKSREVLLTTLPKSKVS